MNFPPLFLILLPLISAYPTGDKTDKSVLMTADEIFDVASSEVCTKDAEKFSKCMEEFLPKDHMQLIAKGENRTKEETQQFFTSTKKSIACIGDITCKPLKMSIFMIESSIFVEEHRNLVEECLEKSSIPQLKEYCTLTIPIGVSGLGRQILTSRCVALRLECTDNDKITFLKSEFARISMNQVGKQVKEQGMAEVLMNFDRTFNPEDFENIEL